MYMYMYETVWLQWMMSGIGDISHRKYFHILRCISSIHYMVQVEYIYTIELNILLVLYTHRSMEALLLAVNILVIL